MILAGDVGGTKTRLGLYSHNAGVLERLAVKRFESAAFPSLEEILKAFLNENQAKPLVACFGIPGPVIEGKVKVTNLPWELDEAIISKDLGIPRVKLVNDLVATAAATPLLRAEDLVTLHSGKPAKSLCVSAVIAPGTGMGQALSVKTERGSFQLPSEGGHVDLSPVADIEIEMLKHLKTKFKHVSVEHVLCGPGLFNIYQFLRDTGYAKESAEIAKRLTSETPAAVISEMAQNSSDELCGKTLDIFVSMLGAHAGNVMVTVMATEGIYLGGGVPPKILKKLQEGPFVKSYLAKGKMAAQVANTSVYVIKDDHAALTGAAKIASEL